MHTPGPASTLPAEQETAARLLALLRTEQQLLVEANVESLDAVIAQKAELIGQMGSLAQQRYNALAAAGHPAQEAGMREWLEQSDAASAESARAAWKAVLEIARTAKEINRTNGLLINRHMHINQAALQALRGTAGTEGFYGRNGQATQQVSSRNLVVG